MDTCIQHSFQVQLSMYFLLAMNLVYIICNIFQYKISRLIPIIFFYFISHRNQPQTRRSHHPKDNVNRDDPTVYLGPSMKDVAERKEKHQQQMPSSSKTKTTFRDEDAELQERLNKLKSQPKGIIAKSYL